MSCFQVIMCFTMGKASSGTEGAQRQPRKSTSRAESGIHTAQQSWVLPDSKSVPGGGFQRQRQTSVQDLIKPQTLPKQPTCFKEAIAHKETFLGAQTLLLRVSCQALAVVAAPNQEKVQLLLPTKGAGPPPSRGTISSPSKSPWPPE